MPVAATRAARYWVLELELPGSAPLACGVLLEDPSADRLYIRLRRDWTHIAGEEAEVLEALEADLGSKAAEMGAARLMEILSDTLSDTVRLGDPVETIVENFDRACDRLYRQNIQSTVERFVTHLPRYSPAIAAGRFLENQEATEESWEETPPRLRLTPEMFVVRIAGRSMEPLIPDGSLCVFRAGVAGSRQGRLVLVERLGRGANDRHTVKRYRSEKRQSPDGSWAHERIILEPLNPEFETWELDPEEDRFRIVAEFVQVLD